MSNYLVTDTELTGVANAIRAKNKSQGSLEFPTDFVSAIANLPSGGNIEEDGNGNLTFSTDGDTVGKIPLTVSANGTYTPPAGKAYSVVQVDLGSPSAKDVIFRDYDGTITNSYSKEEFATLTAMPANPSHEGLTAQGWNWSLADAKVYVAECGRLEIGQMYITDDGKTRVYVHLGKGRTSPMLGVCPNGTVDVDWGDGTAHDTLTGTSTSTVQWTSNHNYAEPGDYVIKLTVTGEMGFYGNTSSNQYSGLLRFSSSSDIRNQAYQNAIQKIEIGSGVTGIENAAFNHCYHLLSITIPKSVTSITNSTLAHCYSLLSITIPNSVIYIGDYAFYSCYNLSSITIPDSVTSIGSNMLSYDFSLSSMNIPESVTSIGNGVFSYCYSLSSITIPNSVTSIGNDAFQNCYNLSSIIILDGVTNIFSEAFYNCQSLSSIIIPNSVTSIGGSVFYNCYSLTEYHFTRATPPTLSNYSSFSTITDDCTIYVPYSSDHSILEAYKTATNWSTYASYMQEEPV